MKMKPTMYHGSDEDFEVFKLPYLEDRIYFSKDYQKRHKTPPFRAGDIRRVRRICVSN